MQLRIAVLLPEKSIVPPLALNVALPEMVSPSVIVIVCGEAVNAPPVIDNAEMAIEPVGAGRERLPAVRFTCPAKLKVVKLLKSIAVATSKPLVTFNPLNPEKTAPD